MQIIPKEHYRWVWDSKNIDEYFILVQKLAKVLQKTYGQDMIRSQIYGDEVEHAHVWLWPELPHDGTEKDFEAHAQKIKSHLS